MGRFVFLIIILFAVVVTTTALLDDMTDGYLSEYITQIIKNKLPIKKK